MKPWIRFALAGLVLAGLAGGLLEFFLAGRRAEAMWVGAGLAYVLQLVAFAGLAWARRDVHLFMYGWIGGMALRFGGLGLLAFWVTRTRALDPEATLLSFVGFVFMLLLLEPVFLPKSTPS